MEPFTFVHIADVHLDTGFASRKPHIRSMLKEAVRNSFKKAVDLCIENRVHCLLIAGDFFDGEKLTYETEKLIAAEFMRLRNASVRVLYCTGNHDPKQNSGRFGKLKWPDNVVIFSDKTPRTVYIESGDNCVGSVTSCGHTDSRVTENLAAGFPEALSLDNRGNPGLPHVAMIHAMVRGVASSGEEPYAPCSVNDLESKGYHYWALGHIHKRQRVSDTFPYWYPGNPQGRNPNECGPKGCHLVKIYPGGKSETEFYPLDSVRWHREVIDDLSKVADFQQLKAGIVQRIDNLREPGLEQLFRFELTGPCPLYWDLLDEDSITGLEEDIATDADVCGVEIRMGGLLPYIDENNIKSRTGPSLLADILNTVDELERDDLELEKMLPDVISSPLGRADEETRRSYMRSLLSNLKEECIIRWMEGGNKR